MCGRYSLISSVEQIRYTFNLDIKFSWRARYNIAPSQLVPVIKCINGNVAVFENMRWGYVPSWSNFSSGNKPMINARSETLSEKAYFTRSFRLRRVLIPADGFYEWQQTHTGKKPYRIQRKDGQPFAFAGLWDHAVYRGSMQPEDGFAIITKKSEKNLNSIHARTPLVVPYNKFKEWLSTDTKPQDLGGLINSTDDSLLSYYAIGKRINSIVNDDSSCLDPIHENCLIEKDDSRETQWKLL